MKLPLPLFGTEKRNLLDQGFRAYGDHRSAVTICAKAAMRLAMALIIKAISVVVIGFLPVAPHGIARRAGLTQPTA
jgi:hypothetical protein